MFNKIKEIKNEAVEKINELTHKNKQKEELGNQNQNLNV